MESVILWPAKELRTRESRAAMRTCCVGRISSTRAPTKELVDVRQVERSAISFTSLRPSALKYSSADLRTSRMSGASGRAQPPRRSTTAASTRSGAALRALDLDRMRVLATRRLDTLRLVVEPTHVQEVDLAVELQAFVGAEIAPLPYLLEVLSVRRALRRLLARVQEVVVRERDPLLARPRDLAVPRHQRLDLERRCQERVQGLEPAIDVHTRIHHPGNGSVGDNVSSEENSLLREIDDQVSVGVRGAAQGEHLHRPFRPPVRCTLRDLLDRGRRDVRVGQGVPLLLLFPSPGEEMLDLLRRVRVRDERGTQRREEAIAPRVVLVRVRVHHVSDGKVAGARADRVREGFGALLVESRVDDQDAIAQLHPSR